MVKFGRTNMESLALYGKSMGTMTQASHHFTGNSLWKGQNDVEDKALNGRPLMPIYE